MIYSYCNPDCQYYSKDCDSINDTLCIRFGLVNQVFIASTLFKIRGSQNIVNITQQSNNQSQKNQNQNI
jgi:hypothetical protein